MFHKNFKFISVSIMVMTLFMVMASASYGASPDNDIAIIYTNDVHCGVDDFIGYAGLSYYKHELEKRTPYVTLIDAGDAVQGATIGAISNGRYIIELMNAVGYDLAVPGNHEFDYGMEQFMKSAKDLSCGYVSCNFRDAVTGQLVFEPYKIFKYGNVKVAIVGACTPESLSKSNPLAFMDELGDYLYDFDGDRTGEKLCASIQKAVNDARDNGADYVILAGHLGEYGGVTPEWSAPFIVAHTRGIDAVIDGHSHEITTSLMIKNADGIEVLVTQTGTKLRYIGQLTIGTDGKIMAELIDSVEGRDSGIDELIAEFKERYEASLRERIGYSSFDLKAVDERGEWLVRNCETNLCDLVSDAFLFEAEKHGGADIAVVNGGTLRADLKAGELTYNDSLTVLPFSVTLSICEVSGQTLIDELEMGARDFPNENGGLLHASGLTYEIDTSIKSSVQLDDRNMFIGISGLRRVHDVLVNGKPIDSERKYKVVGDSFLLRAGGDGHRFYGLKVITPNITVANDALSHYIKSLDIIPERYRTPQGRLKAATIKAIDYPAFMQGINYGDRTTYVIGHLYPDSDSVCSAIAYANLKRKLGLKCEARITASPLNMETAFALKYFDVKTPPVLEDASGQQIILVDHNLFSQAASGMDKANIVEVVDHHNIGGDVRTGAPIYFRAMPVGCTSTIVWLSYVESGIEIDRQMAGMMLSAILSDTIDLKGVTTTDLDRQAAEALQKLAGIEDRTAYFLAMEEELASYAGMTEEEIIYSDYKEFEAAGVNFSISAVLALTPEKREALVERLDTWAKANVHNQKMDMVFLVVNDLETMAANVIAVGEGADEVAYEVFGPADGKYITLRPNIPRKRLIAPMRRAIENWLNRQLEEAA